MIVYRLAEDQDLPFIADSWLRSYATSHSAGMIQMDDFRDVMGPQVMKVLGRPGVTIWVAAWAGEADRHVDVKGWLAVERGFSEVVKVHVNGRYEEQLQLCTAPLVHYVCVKKGPGDGDESYRRKGIARGLFRAAGIDPMKRFLYTCKTGVVSRIQKAGKIPRAEWNPLIARFAPK